MPATYALTYPGLKFQSLFNRDDEWIVVGLTRRNPQMTFREIGYTLIDKDLSYLSLSTVYMTPEKHDFIMPLNHKTWVLTRPSPNHSHCGI